VIKFIYDAEGIRKGKIEGGGEVKYLMDGLAVLCEYDGSGNIKREYVPGISMKENGNIYYYITDRLGNVRYVLNSSGSVIQSYLYSPFGKIHTSSGSLNQPYQYVGEHYYYTEDTIGLKLLGQRWYDSEVGRFISRDPIGGEGGLNLYVYVENHLVNEIDPSGLESCGSCLTRIYDEAVEKSKQNIGAMKGLTGEQRDAFRHCYASCRGVEDCGYLCTWAGGWWNEARCWFRCEAIKDLYNNAHGRKCAKGPFSCRVCCLIKLKEGILWVSGESPPKNDSYDCSTGN